MRPQTSSKYWACREDFSLLFKRTGPDDIGIIKDFATILEENKINYAMVHSQSRVRFNYPVRRECDR